MSTCKGIEPSACRRYLFFVVYIAYWIVLIAMRRYRASFLTEDSFEECKKESFLLQSISSSFISDDLNGNGSDMQHMLRLAAVQHKLLASKTASLYLSPSLYLFLFILKTLFASQEYVEDVEDAPLSACCGKGPQPSPQLVTWRGYDDSSVAIICSSAQSA